MDKEQRDVIEYMIAMKHPTDSWDNAYEEAMLQAEKQISREDAIRTASDIQNKLVAELELQIKAKDLRAFVMDVLRQRIYDNMEMYDDLSAELEAATEEIWAIYCKIRDKVLKDGI